MKISIFQVAYKNLLRKKTRSVLTVLGIALAAWVLVSLFGFNKGYETSLNRDIDNLGFQMLVIAKGCPYEAATLMLKGGTGPQVHEARRSPTRSPREPEVDGVTPDAHAGRLRPEQGRERRDRRLPRASTRRPSRR